MVPYEYWSLLYCHSLGSQPVVYRKECFGGEVATQTLGGFFVSGGRRGVLHASGFRVVPTQSNPPFLVLKVLLRAQLKEDVYH